MKKYFPLDIFIILVVVIILNILRLVIFKSDSFVWLFWNIFLAIIPLAISTYLLWTSDKHRINKIIFVVLAILWLLFIPNAPYIVTDLIHIGEVRAVPVIYDAFLLFGAGWVGIYLWLYSNTQIESLLVKKYSQKITNIIMFLIISLTSFGIYLGRFLRLNSWEIFSDSSYFLKVLHQKLIIKSDPKAYLYLVLFTFFLYGFYFAFRYRNKK
jgi:uncharacterized membrane protein